MTTQRPRSSPAAYYPPSRKRAGAATRELPQARRLRRTGWIVAAMALAASVAALMYLPARSRQAALPTSSQTTTAHDSQGATTEPLRTSPLIVRAPHPPVQHDEPLPAPEPGPRADDAVPLDVDTGIIVTPAKPGATDPKQGDEPRTYGVDVTDPVAPIEPSAPRTPRERPPMPRRTGPPPVDTGIVITPAKVVEEAKPDTD